VSLKRWLALSRASARLMKMMTRAVARISAGNALVSSRYLKDSAA
jgi:hypothetical protein